MADKLKSAVDEATGGAPKSASQPYTYYSPEAKRARREGLVDAVRKRNDAEERLQNQKQQFQSNNAFRETNTYSKGGQVGKIGSFGLKNSKPDFASGGTKSNLKFNFKK